jgi:hypothetical protein
LDDINFYGVAPHWYFRPLMGLLVISPTHYEGLMWMGLFFALLTFIPVIYNWYHPTPLNYPIIPMQNSRLQSAFFLLFILSIACSASMLPCGRYYYEPEGGYVGNPWVKFSYQYIYLYLAWILHQLDTIDFLVYNKAKATLLYLAHYRVVPGFKMSVNNYAAVRARTMRAKYLRLPIRRVFAAYAFLHQFDVFVLQMYAYGGRLKIHSDD